jgi:polyketide synthase PksM
MHANEHSNNEDIAIVGMACRFPCAADYNEYWQNIVSARDCIREVPADRWDWRQYFGDPKVEPNKTSVKWGGFIDDIDKFDPLFFGIAPNEAAFIDPQHRLFLEAAWHAVEDAGYSVASLSGKSVGVYAGVSKNDYSELMRESRYEIAPYISTGTVHSILVNRVSFLFNLRGKSEAVDTACSSSLVALHNAIRDIWSGECEAAIVGGVNALITPTMFISHSKSGMLSPDGQCKTFSAGANGYVRSEGVGVLYIKPLQQALRDGDHVHAVIKSTAISHGGRSNFLTSPTTEAQAAVVMKALRRGNIDPRTVDYIEAHGTGTPLGDPIEINGLKRAFAQLAEELPDGPATIEPHCALSSVKTNIGHLESAAGMAGIIKAVMAMKHRQIPAIRNFERLNPYIELEASPFYIATETAPWAAKDSHGRRAGVSSFGMGGVNAHVVLEEAPDAGMAAIADGAECVFPVSAKKGRLKAYAQSLLEYLRAATADTDLLPLGDIAYTLQAGRDELDERLAVVAASAEDLIVALQRYAAGDGAGAGNLFVGQSRGSKAPAAVPADASASELAARWVQGATVDWSGQSAAGSRRRIPLPTYPFARKRCWFTDVPSRMTNAAVPAPVKPQPGTDFRARSLKPSDFFIRDHVVQGKPTLPGVVHLELARAAASAERPVSVLRDVYWLTPVTVNGENVHADVKLTVQGDRVNFEIVCGETVHSRGSVTDGPAGALPRVDLAAVQSRCLPGGSKAELYTLFREHGLAYGSSFQVIESYARNANEIVAELRLPRDAQDGQSGYVLHPSIMDGIFQAVTALSILGGHYAGKQFVPFYLEAAEIVNATGDRCFVHATVNSAGGRTGASPSFHAQLTDAAGNVLVNIRNLQKRAIAELPITQPAHEAAVETLYYKPVWLPKALAAKAASASGTLVVFANDDRILQSFGEDVVAVRFGAGYQQMGERSYQIDPRSAADYKALLQDLTARGITPARVAFLGGLGVADPNAIYGLLHLTQAAFQLRLREMTLVYAYALSGGLASSVHAMAAGFARTLKYENPKFDYVSVGVDDASLADIAGIVSRELAAATQTTALREVVYRSGERQERQIVREALAGGTEGSAIKHGGVYVISGGAGGLGAVFSLHLAATYNATILWLGRSVKTAATEAKIAEIEQAGGRCEYFSADITDREALNRVFADIKARYGAINGVIHAAGLIEDAFILRKETGSFARVIEPKVLGAANLDDVTRHEALDFFVVFSSIAALMPNQGQCDYAAANSFLDSFAAARNTLVASGERSGVSLALNWPLWANGGMRVTAEEERHLLRVFGMKPLATSDGLAIFETALALATSKPGEVSQLIALGGDQQKIEQCLGVPAMAAPKAGIDTHLKAIFATRLDVTADVIDGGRTIGELGVDSSSILGVIRDINERFGADLKPTLLFDINTVDKLSAYLVGIGKDQAVSPAAIEASPWNRSLIDVAQSDPKRLTFTRTFKTSEFYLRDHVVDGQYNMPGACYVEMARQAGDLVLGDRSAKKLLHNYWASPLSSPDRDFDAHVQMTAKPDHLAYEVVSFTASGEKHLHAMGQIAREQSPAEPVTIAIEAVKARCTEVQYPEKIYAQIHGEGLIVGPTFQPMTQIFLNDDEALAVLELPEEIRSTIGDYVLNPALLTGAFQTSLISNRRGRTSRQYIPIGMDELEVLAPIPAECLIYSRPRPANARNEEMKKFDVDICQFDGLVVVRLKGFSIRALKEAAVSVAPAAVIAANASPALVDDTLLHAVQDLIRTKLAGPVGLPVDEIELNVEFDQYGVTSVMVVELNQIFEEILGAIPKTLFFEYRNIAELAEYFLDNHRDVLARLLRPAPPAPVASEDGDVIDHVRMYLRSLIAGPIGLAADEIDVRAGFDEYGVNSVMVVELNEIFERIFGPLAKTLFFEYRSIDELSQYFLDEHRAKLMAALPGKSVAAMAPAAAAQQASSVERSPAPADEGRDIAIVSAAGRFPGARNLEEFWKVLSEGRDCITEIPEGRFNYRQYFNADPEQNGIYSNWGGFVDDIDRFDPAFFNISPREAELIDPQERLLLEVVWEMLERSGYTRRRLHQVSRGRVGVFVGALWQPYESAGVEATLAGNVVGPSSLLYSIANRVSYFLDLTGPSMAIDTACSSSMTALHLACQSIRDGESECAIAAGVNLSASVSKYLFLSRYHFLSTDGRCRSYGAGGDGYVPGEGICAVLVKPLAKAIADGDSILAVIKGSAINHGGRTNGYTVPNPKAQASVITQALEQARVEPSSITYIEGHGTGTSLGDPIEIAALEKALGLSRDEDRLCAIGSVKSNIGHLEAAAGIASIIKVLLQMKHGQIAPSLHIEQLNPNIDFARSPFQVQRELGAWAHPRRAGISSFGAGGSNAHVILDEFDGSSAATLQNATGPALCVFSARTEERLFALVAQCNDFLRDAQPADLHDIAYTLQLGREPMRERLAVVASSVDELRAALTDFLGRTQQQNTWRRGRVAGKGSANPLATSGRETPDTWWQGQSLSALADAWVQGREVDWTAFHGGRQYGFVTLPTYPFANERYWLDSTAVAAVHPLLQRNSSDATGQRFSSTFTGEEFFLADHQVLIDGRMQKVLPGVACLEMARAAIVQAAPARSASDVLELHNTVWAQPIVVSRAKELSISLTPNGNGEVHYKVTSNDGGQDLLHCQGRGVWTRPSETAKLDLAQLQREMANGQVDGASVYEAFVRTGGVYGPTFQGVTTVHQGNGQSLAYLSLPKTAGQTMGDYVLHPTLMDGSLQPYLGMLDGWSGAASQTRMPFGLESLRILAPCTGEMVAWMRFAPGSQSGDQVVKLDVDLCDLQGRVCVRMRGFSVRAVGSSVRENRKTLTLAPVWDAVKVDASGMLPGAGQRVVIIGGNDEQHRGLWQQCGTAEVLQVDGQSTMEQIAQQLRGGARIDHLVWVSCANAQDVDDDTFIEAQEAGVLLGFRLIKALLQEGYGAADLTWTVITSNTQRIGARRDETIEPAHASIHGLIGSMAKEYRNWKVRLVDIAGSVWPWGELLRLRSDERGDGLAWRDRQWYRRRLVPCELAANAEGGFRHHGVYVVIGGAGGVGAVLTEHLIRKYDARVVWIGRRPQDEAIEQKQAGVTAGGGERPLYIAADARNREELERACEQIKTRYGRIHGVIHSAIILSDKSLANMAEEQFRAALSTKVDVAVRLAQVFGQEPLDFLLYFSSLQSFLKAPGQSNYAAGCTFTDAFAEWQSAGAGYPVKVMNWGYWGNVGIVASAEYQERMARLGWGSLEPEEGMAGVEHLLAAPLEQAGMIRTNGPDALQALGVADHEAVRVAPEAAPTVCERLVDGLPAIADATRDLATWQTQRRGFDDVLARMLGRQLRAITGVATEYERWLEESRRIVAAHGCALNTAGGDDQLRQEWEREATRLEGQGMAAEVKLVDTTLRSLDFILRGQTRATDVIFPGSSLSLVEGVYKNNAVADDFNRVMADVVCWYVEQRKSEARAERGTNLRLLELGAGTGGSSQGILRKLDAYRQHIEEYRYTDVSKIFLVHGEKTYGAGREYLKYAVVDVEKSLQGQGIEGGSYDVVLAANVLHATKRLRETLRNAKAALKANGLLILNEITAKSVFMHLTFGLLSGWWAYEDQELRMDGSPGLTPEAWQCVLEEEGFRNVCFPAQDASGLGQQIIVAESDGVIRQKHTVAPAPRKALHEVVAAPVAAVAAPATAPSGELLAAIEAWLVEAVGVLLKVKRQDVDLDAELSEFGFDSISLTGFANHVNQGFALELMPTIFFEHPTVRRFATYLVDKHAARLAETLVVKAQPLAQPNSAGLLEKVEAWLVEAVGVLLKVKREDVDLDAELSEFGFDSISLTGFANHVNQAYALELMPTLFFEHPTVKSIARYLVDNHAQRLMAKLGVQPVAAVPVTVPVPAAPTRAVAVDVNDTEAIAIIGMSGKFPEAEDLDAFWTNLQAGKESVREIPLQRWDWRAIEGSEREDGTMGGAQWGAFMDGVEQFDPLFFGISPREAERIDPQHRLTMMYGWKAFEDAGYGPKQLSGSRTGVFIGTTSTGYSELLMRAGAGIEGYTATGIVPSVGPNRLSYLLNLHGPSEPIETACSSSLVAVHRAVHAIRAGDCDMALVGGVNTLFPTLHTSFNKAGMLSPDGKCKTFSSSADGYARGEGVGMIVLKKLSAAERDGDHIYGLVRGSAENHGGRAQSLTAPNPNAQAALIKDAYRRAGVSPRSVTYIEAHGTGTPLGDPIEINGLKSAFQGLSDELAVGAETNYCGLGSVKTNIGHLELAAGIAGLIKILLQLKHETLVSSLHCDEINPYIKLEESPFFVVRENQPWRRSTDAAGRELPLRAGISSFGFGGVNAHLLIEEYTGATPAAAADARPVMVVLSAKDAARLQEQAVQLRQWIVRRELRDGDLASLAYTLQVGREAMDHRMAMNVASIAELVAKLDAFLDGQTGVDGLYRGEVKRNSETLALFRGDEELREAIGKWIARGKWPKLLDLWVKGLEIEWEQVYGDARPRRLSLPTYPFAKVRCWLDVPSVKKTAAPLVKETATTDTLHPLLHRNTSDFLEQRYSSTFTGEESFLADHQVGNGRDAQKVLPGVAYLEMARAAVRQASRNHGSSILEMRDVLWIKPVIVNEPKQVSITLSEVSDDAVEYEIHSNEGEHDTVHCAGTVVFTNAVHTAKLDLAGLRQQMIEGRCEASDLYAACTEMGLHYGPAHRGVTAIRLGEKQLLAELRLPAAMQASSTDYVLHPSVMDSALQASLGLFINLHDLAGKPPVPFGLDTLRILAPSTTEMVAWVRYANGSEPGSKAVKVDIDLCDQQGNVCVELRGLSSRVLDADARAVRSAATRPRLPIKADVAIDTTSAFDDAFYQELIADVVNRKVSVDEASDLE